MTQQLQPSSLFGSFITDTTPVMILAYSNAVNIYNGSSDGNVAFPVSPGWYILTEFTYERTRDSTPVVPSVTELTLTPYYNGKFKFNNPTPQVDSLLTLAELDSNLITCQVKSNLTEAIPIFQYNNPTNDNLDINQDVYEIKKIVPAIVTLKYSAGGGFNIISNGRTASCINGVARVASPYNSIVVYDPQEMTSGASASPIFQINGLFNSNTVMVDPPTLYAGYPYQITNQEAYNGNIPEKPSTSPFRNFLQLIACKTGDDQTAQRYVSTENLNIHGTSYYVANFFNANYIQHGSEIEFSPGTTNDKTFNIKNETLNDDTKNIGSTIQFYFIPLSYMVSEGNSTCAVYSDLTGQLSLDNILTPLYQGKGSNTSLCISSPGSCFFSDLNNCELGFWQQYCLDSNTSCGACFGKCVNSDPLSQFCRIKDNPSSSVPFICGPNPNPEPPPPPKQESFFEKYKMWIYGGIVTVVIFFVFAIFLSIAIARPK